MEPGRGWRNVIRSVIAPPCAGGCFQVVGLPEIGAWHPILPSSRTPSPGEAGDGLSAREWPGVALNVASPPRQPAPGRVSLWGRPVQVSVGHCLLSWNAASEKDFEAKRKNRPSISDFLGA